LGHQKSGREDIRTRQLRGYITHNEK
jgi:hypothetical protein